MNLNAVELLSRLEGNADFYLIGKEINSLKTWTRVNTRATTVGCDRCAFPFHIWHDTTDRTTIDKPREIQILKDDQKITHETVRESDHNTGTPFDITKSVSHRRHHPLSIDHIIMICLVYDHTARFDPRSIRLNRRKLSCILNYFLFFPSTLLNTLLIPLPQLTCTWRSIPPAKIILRSPVCPS